MSQSKRKAVVVTGTRAEYGILKPLLHRINSSKKLELYLIVAGMHLEKKFGYSKKQILDDGFKIFATVAMAPLGNTGFDMAIALSKGIDKFAKIFKKLNPEFNIVFGDRAEPLAAALAAMNMNIVNVHIHGGDTSKGGIDEYMRHAITKISNLHFAATPLSANRIIKLGENKKFVHMSGSLAIDGIGNKYSKRQTLMKYGLRNNYILMVQHPVTTQIKYANYQIRTTLDALIKLKRDAVIIGPNSDAGHYEIFHTIKKYTAKHKFLKFYTNLPRDEYLSLLKYCALILGNSSSGIVDAPSFKKATINIGIRQLGRESASNVIHVRHNVSSILAGVKRAESEKFKKILKKCTNPYGNGTAAKKILTILENQKITDELIQKKLTY